MNRKGHLVKTKEFVFPAILLIIFVMALRSALRWDWQTFLLPFVAASAGILFLVLELVKEALTAWKRGTQAIAEEINQDRKYTGDLTYDSVGFSKGLYEGVIFFAWVGAFFFGVRLMGFHISIPLFTFLYLKVEGKAPWLLSTLLAVLLLTFVWIVFDWFISIAWDEPLLMYWLRAN